MVNTWAVLAMRSAELVLVACCAAGCAKHSAEPPAVASSPVSELLQITRTKVEGITKDMPVVGRWKSKEGDVFYLAIGIVLDKAGEPVKAKTEKKINEN